ncbi:hypothetical protein FHX15_004456 [Rhizobium sp. BK650]|uniref:hypothetical protein n=1 Tax=Rhizobium sp. BK650 TaxID=2586990 RepID=UPI0018153D27|nr:hypothetical protein [Rhizobium sp. BK650]MBB3659192.1 hypothetical protein [Rhizobium sp. BK650]
MGNNQLIRTDLSHRGGTSLARCLLPGTSAIGGTKNWIAHALSAPEFAGDRKQNRFPGTAKARPPSSKIILSTFLILWLASCADQDDQFHKRMQEILSWSATAEMILDARLGALVPKGFTALAVERCQKEILDLSSQLPQTSQQAEAKANIVKLDKMIGAVKDDVDHGRFDAGRQRLTELQQYTADLRKTSGADE